MKKFRTILIICLAACCMLACVTAAACSSQNWRIPSNGVTDDGSIDKNNPNGDLPFYYPEGVDPADYEDSEDSYTIKTVSMGGLSINGVRITVKKGGEKIVEGISENGGAKFLIPLDDYDLEYSGLPIGYYEDSEGTVKHLTAQTTSVTTAFNSSVIQEDIPAGKVYNLGDVMYDFSVTDADGNTFKLSTALQTKRAVLLNFWATWCDPCRVEFPSINRVYANYSTLMDVVALSTTDTNSAAKGFKDQNSYTFFMSGDGAGLHYHFDTDSSGIPVSVMVDRYGVLSYYKAGSEPSDTVWNNMFETFTADDYEQSIQQGETGDTGTEPEEPTLPEDGLQMADEGALNQAFHDDTVDDLDFYEPAEDTRDGKYNWHFGVDDNDSAGQYITPQNIGKDNTWSIIYTDVEVGADQTLWVDVKVKGDPDDVLTIVLNNSTELMFTRSGDTNGWETIELFSSTRPSFVNIGIIYTKSYVGSPEDEFVGLRNLKITNNDYESGDTLDVRTEAVMLNDDGTLEYPNIYKASDGFYRIQRDSAAQNPETDPWLFADILSESLWSDRHLKDYRLSITENGETAQLTKSVYLISYWHRDFGDSANKGANDPLNFNLGDTDEEKAKNTDTIIDNYWIQDGNSYLAPVDETLATALKAFAKRASEYISEYQNGYDDKTWLELCSYYRTMGTGDHSAEGHTCLARTNMGVGKTLNYAIEATMGSQFTVDLQIGQRKNRGGGVFYKFTAPQTGVYVFTSYRPFSETDPIDPKIMIWPNGSDAYNDEVLLLQEDCNTIERFTQNESGLYTSNFKAYLYLEAGTVIYPQFTVAAGDISQVISQYISSGIDVTYKVDIQYVGESKHVLTLAATDGMWNSTTDYAGIDVVVNEDDGTYYHMLENNNYGSMVYIDFIHATYMSDMGIEQALETDYFKTGDVDYTPLMKQYLAQAKAKDPEDPTYGMMPATNTIVNILSSVIRANSDDGDGLETGAWKGFAYYWQYYGPTAWEELPE